MNKILRNGNFNRLIRAVFRQNAQFCGLSGGTSFLRKKPILHVFFRADIALFIIAKKNFPVCNMLHFRGTARIFYVQNNKAESVGISS